MTDALHHVDILIVGAGPAGIAAICALRNSSHSVLWIDQRTKAGGAIHRQPANPGVSVSAPKSVKAQWERLDATVRASAIPLKTQTVFVGLDADGIAVLDDRASGTSVQVAAKVIIFAIGAIERVLPRPGWTLSNVWTAGGMQVMLKEAGEAPKGKILVAGNGPLTIALGAQLAEAGNAPVVVLEAGNPTANPLRGLPLLTNPRLLFEARHYLQTLKRHDVTWQRQTRVTAIKAYHGALRVHAQTPDGEEIFDVDHVALHDGIRPNAFGLVSRDEGPLVIRAGDCRETLGAIAAEADGERAAKDALAHLSGTAAPAPNPAIAVERRSQETLKAMFAAGKCPSLNELPEDTILCRCEGSTVSTLKRLLAQNPGMSPREIKLNGRFGMGRCQGRFCADNVAALLGQTSGDAVTIEASALTGTRWPIRPVSIASLITDTETTDTK